MNERLPSYWLPKPLRLFNDHTIIDSWRIEDALTHETVLGGLTYSAVWTLCAKHNEEISRAQELKCQDCGSTRTAPTLPLTSSNDSSSRSGDPGS